MICISIPKRPISRRPHWQYAEESYDVLRLKFSHEVTSRIPLIVYASHSDFEQTNILPFTPPEGLLGVTDFLKRRVTLPFRGNLAEFRHTMRHELVHAFQISLGIDRYNRSPRSSGAPIPLWWTEGLAEYWSAGEDARDEMILRDLVFTGRLPDIDQLTFVTGGIVYPWVAGSIVGSVRPTATGGRRSCITISGATCRSRMPSRPSTAERWPSSPPNSSSPCGGPTIPSARSTSRLPSPPGWWQIRRSSHP